MWVKGLPFKISFFMWKRWKGNLPLDDVIRRMGYYMPSKYWCCVMPKDEILSHVFYRSLTALKVWSYFYSHAGLSREGLNLHQAIEKYWTTKPGIDRVPFRWLDILRMMENYTPKLKFNKVSWELPMTGWTKINTDGALRGNPGRSSLGFCLRNEEGDQVYACGKEIQEVTNTQAETRAIMEALKHCLTNEMNNI
ncbi:uncharacterized protein LOC142162113 [Nicotiana tabacum]|uniref:Uncharacterized protein LOC142162113 n=1 Tax=Nicotiana tabacum TaxID=4097 RepID=A0AC58RP79_TOBAC